jgi:hypothetical protein
MKFLIKLFLPQRPLTANSNIHNSILCHLHILNKLYVKTKDLRLKNWGKYIFKKNTVKLIKSKESHFQEYFHFYLKKGTSQRTN